MGLYSQLLCFDLFHARNENLVFNLVRKILVEDQLHIRCMAVARRLLQLCALQGEPGAAFGSLSAFSDFMLAKKTELRRILKAESDKELIDETEEYFDDGAEPKVRPKLAYDPSVNCRDPKFARPHEARLWEMWAFKNHLHPEVQSNAKKLLHMDTFCFNDNPFEKCGVSTFLDVMNLVNQNTSRCKEYNDTKKRVAPEEEFHAQYFRDMKVASKKRKVDKKVDVEDVDVDEDAVDADTFFREYLESQGPKVDDEIDEEDEEDDDDDEESAEASAAFSDKKEEEKKIDMSDFHSLSIKEKRKKQKKIFAQYSSPFASADDFAALIGKDDSAEDVD